MVDSEFARPEQKLFEFKNRRFEDLERGRNIESWIRKLNSKFAAKSELKLSVIILYRSGLYSTEINQNK